MDNCRALQVEGLTDDYVNLESLSLINVGLTTLKGFPNLPNLAKVRLVPIISLVNFCFLPNLSFLSSKYQNFIVSIFFSVGIE